MAREVGANTDEKYRWTKKFVHALGAFVFMNKCIHMLCENITGGLILICDVEYYISEIKLYCYISSSFDYSGY